MYWKLFEELYEAHAKRKAVERCMLVKDAIVAGVWSNSNYDAQEQGKEGPRRQLLEAIDEQFDQAVKEIYGKAPAKEDIDWDDPFFQASKAPRMNPKEEMGIPEAQEKKRMMEELDQI